MSADRLQARRIEQSSERMQRCQRADRPIGDTDSPAVLPVGHPRRNGLAAGLELDFVMKLTPDPARANDRHVLPDQRMPRITHLDHPRIAGIML